MSRRVDPCGGAYGAARAAALAGALLKLLIALGRWFPHGGAQRDALAVAECAARRGHAVRTLLARADAPVPAAFDARIERPRGVTNHGRLADFARRVADSRRAQAPCTVLGFERMAGLDAWFAADPCYAERLAGRARWHRWTPRARSRLAAEQAVLGPPLPLAGVGTRILLLDPRQRAIMQRHYDTPAERFVELPASVAPDRRPPADADARRLDERVRLGLGDDQRLLLCVGADPRRKGFDRAIAAFAKLPPRLLAGHRLHIVGPAAPRALRRQALRLGVTDRVTVEAGHSDVLDLLLAADVLVHPAREENTGTVIAEALACGLPVLCTDVCGHARLVADSGGGQVLASPWRDDDLREVLEVLDDGALAQASARASRWAQKTPLDAMHDRIVDALEGIDAERSPP